MNSNVAMVRVVGAALAAGAAAAFACGLTYIASQWAPRYQVMPTTVPGLYQILAPYAFVVPVLVLLLGAFIGGERKSELGTEIIVVFGWLFALAWPLGCIWGWLTPFIRLGAPP